MCVYKEMKREVIFQLLFFNGLLSLLYGTDRLRNQRTGIIQSCNRSQEESQVLVYFCAFVLRVTSLKRFCSSMKVQMNHACSIW